jgi:hypothetical protein
LIMKMAVREHMECLQIRRGLGANCHLIFTQCVYVQVEHHCSEELVLKQQREASLGSANNEHSVADNYCDHASCCRTSALGNPPFLQEAGVCEFVGGSAQWDLICSGCQDVHCSAAEVIVSQNGANDRVSTPGPAYC